MNHPPDLPARALQAAAGAPVDTVEVPALLATAIRERLQGVLWRLVDSGVVEATVAERAAVKAAYRDRVVHTVRLFRLLLALQRDLDQADIPFVVLKGPAAAALDHGASHDRLYNDLDLLVRGRDLDRTVQVLQAAGGVREAPQLRPGYDARFAKNVTVRMPDGLELDLHRTVTPEPFGTFIDEAALFSDLQTFVMGHHTFTALSPLNRFLHACYHAVLGGDARIVPLLDARMLVSRMQVQDVVARAAAWRAQAVVARAVKAMGDRLDLPADDPLARWAAAYRPTRYESLVLRHTVDHRARQSWRTLLTLPYLDGWGERRAYLAGLVWPSQAFLEGRGTSRSQWLERGRRTVLSRLGRGQTGRREGVGRGRDVERGGLRPGGGVRRAGHGRRRGSRPRDRRDLRLAHLTTVDMSLAILLGTELRIRVEEGVQVYGISARGEFVPKVEALGVTHVPIPSFSRSWGVSGDLRASWELYRALRRIRPHVLHTHTPKAGILGRLIGRLAGVPVVVNTCHGLWATREDGLLKRALVIGAEVVASQFSDAELYQNDDDRQRLSRWVRQSKTKTVGNGIDLERFQRDEEGRARVRAEWGIGPDDVVVGGVGRRVAEKGIAEFGYAARALADMARFVWVGPDDPDKPDSLRESEEGVQFVGFRDDMPAVYSAFDIFCLPSYREGFSRSAMEAAACGCALVLSDIRGCRELGSHRRELILVPPGSASVLANALSDMISSESVPHLATAIRTRAHGHFDQRRVAHASWNAYQSLRPPYH